MTTGYAIRFLPADLSDASPSLYLSSDGNADQAARLTAVPADVQVYESAIYANIVAPFAFGELRRADRANLTADVVPLADALRDLAD